MEPMRELKEEKTIGFSDTEEVSHATEDSPQHHRQQLASCPQGSKEKLTTSLLMEKWRGAPGPEESYTAGDSRKNTRHRFPSSGVDS